MRAKGTSWAGTRHVQDGLYYNRQRKNIIYCLDSLSGPYGHTPSENTMRHYHYFKMVAVSRPLPLETTDFLVTHYGIFSVGFWIE